MYATDTSPASSGGAPGSIRRPATAIPTPSPVPERPLAPTRIPAQRQPRDDGSWPLEHRPEAAGEARHRTQALLADWQVADESQDSILLVVSELVTNAVEHAKAPITLRVSREHAHHRIWIGVTDGGPASRDGAWTRSCAHDEHGRGLSLVEALCEIHGTRTHPSGNSTHWARINPAAA